MQNIARSWNVSHSSAGERESESQYFPIVILGLRDVIFPIFRTQCFQITDVQRNIQLARPARFADQLRWNGNQLQTKWTFEAADYSLRFIAARRHRNRSRTGSNEQFEFRDVDFKRQAYSWNLELHE